MTRMRMAAAGLMMAALAGTAGCASMREKMGMDSSDGMSASGMEASGTMAASGGMQMSEADKRMMASCMAMTKDQMMKNRRCQDMAKMHPEMMNKGTTNPM